MHTIDIDDETYASLEVLAREEHASIGSVVKRAVSRMAGFRKAAEPGKKPHGYRIPISKGARSFSSEDVYTAEDENDMRGLS